MPILVVSVLIFIVSVDIMFWLESGATVVESVVVVVSPLLLQATNAPAITTTDNNFFIVPWF